MEEDTNDVILDTPNETEQGESVEVTETETEASPEVDVEKLQATNKKLFERAKKAETELKTLKTQPKESTLPTPAADTGSIYEQVALLKDIERDEMDSLESDAKDLGVPVIKYLKSTAGKTRLEAIRKEKKSKDASPAIGSSSPVFKKYTQEDLSKMTAAELEKILPKAE